MQIPGERSWMKPSGSRDLILGNSASTNLSTESGWEIVRLKNQRPPPCSEVATSPLCGLASEGR